MRYRFKSTCGAKIISHFQSLIGADIQVNFAAVPQFGIELLCQNDASTCPGRLNEPIKPHRWMNVNRSLWLIGNNKVARQNCIAAVLHPRDCHLVAGINHLHSSQFLVGLTRSLHRCPLSREQLIAVGIFKFTHDFVLLPQFVALAVQKDRLTRGKLRSESRLQPAGHELLS